VVARATGRSKKRREVVARAWLKGITMNQRWEFLKAQAISTKEGCG